MAPTGQAEAQAGSLQCMQSLRTNLSPRASPTAQAVSDNVGSGSVLKPCVCLQAAAQLPHPMHCLTSINMAFCEDMRLSLSGDRLPEEFFGDLLTDGRIKPEEKSFYGQAAILRQGRIELLNHARKKCRFVLDPGGNHRAVKQISGVRRKLGGLDDAHPTIAVWIFDSEIRVLENFVIERNNHTFNRREEIDALPALPHSAQPLALAHPAVQFGDLNAVDLTK